MPKGTGQGGGDRILESRVHLVRADTFGGGTQPTHDEPAGKQLEDQKSLVFLLPPAGYLPSSWDDITICWYHYHREPQGKTRSSKAAPRWSPWEQVSLLGPRRREEQGSGRSCRACLEQRLTQGHRADKWPLTSTVPLSIAPSCLLGCDGNDGGFVFVS